MATATSMHTLKGNWFFWNDVYEALKERSYDNALGNKVSGVKKLLHDGLITAADMERLKTQTTEAQFTEREASAIAVVLTMGINNAEAQMVEAQDRILTYTKTRNSFLDQFAVSASPTSVGKIIGRINERN